MRHTLSVYTRNRLFRCYHTLTRGTLYIHLCRLVYHSSPQDILIAQGSTLLTQTHTAWSGPSWNFMLVPPLTIPPEPFFTSTHRYSYNLPIYTRSPPSVMMQPKATSQTSSQKSSTGSFMSMTALTNTTTPPETNALLYIIRKDLRVSDNPILHYLSQNPSHGFTHLVPIYVFPPHQLEVSGLIPPSNDFQVNERRCPYPEARSREGRFWRCGPHRAKFTAESVWSMRDSLQCLGSDLTMRVGYFDEVVRILTDQLQRQGIRVGAAWMTAEEGREEKDDEVKVQSACQDIGIAVKFWTDEKFFTDE